MSVGLNVWIGVRPELDVWQDEYSDARSVAPTKELCQKRIDELAENGAYLVPVPRLLILKGRISDR